MPSVHSRYGLHARQVAFTTFYTRGFGRFIASTPAPVATGWNDSCRVGISPTEKSRLVTAHVSREFPDIVEMILDGRQPDGMTWRELRKPFPMEWERQREKWGIQ